MKFINEPIDQIKLVTLDLTDASGTVTHQQAHYKVTEKWELLGFGGIIQTIGLPPMVNIGNINVPELAEIEGLNTSFPTHLSGAEGVGIAISEITQLVIDTGFSIATTKIAEREEVILFPEFNNGQMMRKTWTVPWEFPRLRLITCAAGGIDGYHVFLFGWKDLRIYRLPLPNIYDHGALCIGNNTMPSLRAEEGILERHKIALKALCSNTWNSDLITLEKIERCRKMFRWDTNGAQLPIDGDPKIIMSAIASPWASNLFMQLP